jgi:transcriptional regulator of heat shock response
MKVTIEQLKNIIKEELKGYNEGFLGLTTSKSKEQQLSRMTAAASVLNQIEQAGQSMNKDAAWETISKLIKDFKASDAGKELYQAYEKRTDSEDMLRRQHDEPHGPSGEMPRKYRRGER